MEWITDFINENEDDWEEKRKERIEKERKRIREWEKLSRLEKIKRIRKEGLKRIESKKEENVDNRENQEERRWSVWRRKEEEGEKEKERVEEERDKEEEIESKINVRLADPKLPINPRNPPKITEANEGEETRIVQKDGKEKEVKKPGIQPAGRNEGGGEEEILEEENEAKDGGLDRGAKVKMKQQGIRIFLKAGNSLQEGQVGLTPGKRQEVRGEEAIEEIEEVSKKDKESKEEDAEAVTPGKKSDKRASEDDTEVKDGKKYKMKVKEAKIKLAEDKIGKTSDKIDKTKPGVKKQGKSVKIRALKPAKKPEKSIKPSKKVSEDLVSKITLYFKKKPDGDLPDSEFVEEGEKVENKEVETSQPEPICQAPSSQYGWVGSSQIVPSSVVSVKNSSHVIHQSQQQQQQSSCSNCDHLVTGQNGPCSNGCLYTRH